MRYRALLLSTTMFGALAASLPAVAQEGGIEIVTVTARQRSESIQVTPVAVTAISGMKLEKTFARDLTDLTRVAPGFFIEAVGAINRTAGVIYSRGIGYSGIDQAIDPAVGVSVDGMFYPRNMGMLQQMYDASGIEILRGPQGTLFGKNTTGGVIKIRTSDPVQGVYSIDGYLKMGDYGRQDYGAIVNVPLTDTLALRIAAQSTYSDGYVKNTYINPVTGNGPSSRDAWLSGDDIKTYRGSLKWDPNENFTATLKLTYIKDRSDSAGGQNGSAKPFGPGFTAGGDALAGPLGTNVPGFGYGAPPPSPQNAYIVQRNYVNYDGSDSQFVTLNMTYNAPWFDIESQTGYQSSTSLTFSDFDDTGLAFFETYTPKKHRYFQQELRLLSNDKDSALQWVGGIFYSWYYFSVEQQFQSIVAPLAPAAQTREGATQNAWSIAPFIQVDYKITPQLTVTGGIRYTNETKALTRFFQVPVGTFKLPANVARGEKTSDAFTYHANISYQINDDAMVYGSFSTGFKSGSFNSRAPNGTTIAGAGLPADFFINPASKPEKVKAFEVGAKTDWFDNRLRVNLSAFWNDYTDLQVQYFLPLAGAPQVLANNANELGRGIEIEVDALPIEHLTLSASVSYLDARYTEFVADLGNQNFVPTVCTAPNPPPDHAKLGPCYLKPYRAPIWSGRFQATYDWDLPRDMGRLTPTVIVGLEGSHITDLNNHPNGLQPTYITVDGSLTYTDPTDMYKISIWAKNVTNTLRKLSAVPSSGFFTQLYFAEPRTFGVQLNFKMSSEEK